MNVANSKSFSAQSSFDVLRAACDLVGVSSDGAELIRLGENALYRLLGCPVIVRIARTMNYWTAVQKEVSVARWLASSGFPAAEVVSSLPQPIAVNGHPVTFWHAITGRDGNRADIAALGACATQTACHACADYVPVAGSGSTWTR